jgi:lysozyme
MNVSDLINDIKRDEGYRASAYRDTVGRLTIGYGFLIEAPGGLLPGEGDYMLANRLSPVVTQLPEQFSWFANMSDARKRALANMAYQMGISGLLEFKDMLHAFANGNYNEAADHALDSLWAKQTPARAQRIAAMIRQG